MEKNERYDFTGKNENDELSELKKARKKLEDELKKHHEKEQIADKIRNEKDKIRALRSEVKKKRKSKSFTSKAFKRLKSLEGEAERVVHPERFSKKTGKRKKGKSGRR